MKDTKVVATEEEREAVVEDIIDGTVKEKPANPRKGKPSVLEKEESTVFEKEEREVAEKNVPKKTSKGTTAPSGLSSWVTEALN